MLKSRLAVFTALVSPFLIAVPAAAQIDEVIVTAQKRSENI